MKAGTPCEELEITRQTFYRHVAPNGSLREDGKKVLGTCILGELGTKISYLIGRANMNVRRFIFKCRLKVISDLGSINISNSSCDNVV
jgi:hypothetical protein